MEEFSRIQRLPPYVFNITGELKVNARRRGEDIIDFGMGNPDGATPKHIVDKMIEAAQKPVTHRYSVSRGMPRLRKAICNWYKSRYDVDLDPASEAIVTIGSKEGIAHLCLAILDSRDTVARPQPQLPHPHLRPRHRRSPRRQRPRPRLRSVSGRARIHHPPHDPAPQGPHRQLPRRTPPRSASTCPSSRASSPSPASMDSISSTTSPTPTSASTDTSRPPSSQVPGAKDVAVEFFTLSKSYNMPGWRVGFMVGNPVLVNALAR